MSTYRLPAYLVLEIPPPVCDAVQAMRDSLATPTSRLPVEMTVAGSSGIGPILPGTDRSTTEERLKCILSGLRAFPVRFLEIRRFPNTNVFYLAPLDREPFQKIHDLLRECEIPFGPNPWPYHPHCTLRSGPMTDRHSAEDIFSLPFPQQEFVIDTFSIYEFDSRSQTCHLSFQERI